MTAFAAGWSAAARVGLALFIACASVVLARTAAIGAEPVTFSRGSQAVLSNPAVPKVAGANVSQVFPVDLNGDGLSDLVIGMFIDRPNVATPIRIMINNGDGSFRDGTTEIVVGPVPHMSGPQRILTADFNGDGRPDIFIAGTGYDHDPWPGEPNVLLLSTADGRLVDASDRLPRQNGYSHGAAVADINGAGVASIYVGGYWSGNNTVPPYLLINDGSGHFRRCGTECLPSDMSAQLRVGSAYTAAAFVDANQDGFPDLVLGGDIDAVTRILLNDRQGRFVDAPVQPAVGLFGPKNTNTVSILASDLDGDGKEDLVLSQTANAYAGRAIQILMSNGDGTFRDESVTRLGASAIDSNSNWTTIFRPLDVNGDGIMDFYGANAIGRQSFIFLNDGLGYFTPVTNAVIDNITSYQHALVVNRIGQLPDVVNVYPDWAGTDWSGNPAYQTFRNTSPIKPASGWWWNPSEGGRGYALEVRGSTVFFAAFMYDDGGEARWYVATGPVSGGVFEADLQRYGGPGTDFWGTTTGVVSGGSVGRIRIAFSSTSAGTMTWPGGTTAIQRFDFTANGAQRGPAAGLPESGWYVDPDQMGKGWYIEFQGRQAFVGFFTYSQGRPVWLVASGTVSGSLAPMLEASLSLYCCGKTFSSGGATGLYAGSAGHMTLSFRDSTRGRVRLPDGSVVEVTRFRF